MFDFNYLKNHTIFISGTAKNCGKTTFMNFLSAKSREYFSSVRLSIGVDGEPEDIIYGNPKPSVYVEKDDVIVTSEGEILRSDAVYEILHIYPFRTVLGKIVLAKACREGMVELIGPENNVQLSGIISHVRENISQNIMVDGALNRITQISSSDNSLFFYILRVNQKNIQNSVNIVKRFSLLERLPLYNGEEKAVVWEGALTDRRLSQQPEEKAYVIGDFTKIFLSDRKLRELSCSGRLFLRHPVKLCRFVINLEDVSEEEFSEKTDAVKHKLMYNPYRTL